MTPTLPGRLMLAAIGLVALTGCGSGGSSGPEADRASESADAPTTASASASTREAFEGQWLSDPISRADAARVLEEAGMAEALEPFLAMSDAGGVPFPVEGGDGDGLVISLELEAGQWTALFSLDGSPFETLDTGGSYVVDGHDSLVYTNLGAQITTLGWAVTDGALEFEWRSGNEVTFQGVTEEVIQRVLYTSQPYRPAAS